MTPQLSSGDHTVGKCQQDRLPGQFNTRLLNPCVNPSGKVPGPYQRDGPVIYLFAQATTKSHKSALNMLT